MPFVIEWTTHCLGTESQFDIDTPAGRLTVTACNDTIIQSQWHHCPAKGGLHPLQSHLSRYWQDPHASITLKLLVQGSPFQQAVQIQLCQTQIGETVTYASIAKIIGTSARAVGNACRRNPYPVLIPCHRIVSANGPGGYCGQTQGELMVIKTGC